MQNAYEKARDNKGKCSQLWLCICPTSLATYGLSVKAVSGGQKIADIISTFNFNFITAAISLEPVLLG